MRQTSSIDHMIDHMMDEVGVAADRDAAGVKRDLEAQGRNEISEQDDTAARARDLAADLRDDGCTDRDSSATERDEIARRRDSFADRRDRSAERRDSAADARDDWVSEPVVCARTLSGDTATSPLPPNYADEYMRQLLLARCAAASDRRYSSADRAAAVEERASARVDREAAGRDRESGFRQRSLSENDRKSSSVDRDTGASERAHANDDRADALVNRLSAAKDRHNASFDELTGAYTRDAGFVELNREIERSRRLAVSLFVAFVDVDHFKQINDTYGHLAGDEALIRVAETLMTTLRTYDLVVRYGGDEFLAALTGLDLITANQRLAQVALTLATNLPAISISVGMAQLQPGDTATDLVARADVAMYRTRGQK